jgi:transcriptional regulator with XRE-family HTH domain
MNIGARIKKLRMEQGLSQEELGAMLGVQRAAVQKWENGTVKNLKRESILKLSNTSLLRFTTSLNAIQTACEQA